MHAKNLAIALIEIARAHDLPEPELVGFGGMDLQAAGVTALGDPVGEATVHAKGIAKALPFYVGLIRRACERFQGSAETPAPDVFVPVDSPALHVPMARAARRMGVPTMHFIAPQFWGWAPWRIGRYRKNVAHAFTILPFEPHWYRRHKMPVSHVGHPLLDDLAKLPVPPKRNDARRTDWVLLPGSRRGEIEDNLAWMLRAMAPLLAIDPKLQVHIAQSRSDHADTIKSILDEQDFRGSMSNEPNASDDPRPPRPQLHIGDLHGVLAHCRGALAVSGTVLTDLLVHKIPSVVIYADPGGWKGKLKDRLLTTGMFASTNLIAGRSLLPEYCFGDDGPLAQVGQDLVRMHTDLEWREQLGQELDTTLLRLGGPGACERTARIILEVCADLQARE